MSGMGCRSASKTNNGPIRFDHERVELIKGIDTPNGKAHFAHVCPTLPSHRRMTRLLRPGDTWGSHAGRAKINIARVELDAHVFGA